jgi:hypothetical protein
MRQDETNSLFRMKLIRSQSAAHTASTGPLTHEDGVRQSDLKARVGGGPFSFYGRPNVIIKRSRGNAPSLLRRVGIRGLWSTRRQSARPEAPIVISANWRRKLAHRLRSEKA